MTTHTIPLDADKIDEVLLKSDTYPALTNNTAQFLRGDGTFAEVTSSVSTHESTHRSNGTDALDVKNLAGYPGDITTFLRGDGSFATIPVDKLTDLAVADDVTTHNATTTRPGLCPKGENTGTKYLRDDLSWQIPPGSGGVEFGTTAGTACEGNDARLSDARDPNSHAVSHKSTGTDSIKLDELAAPDDITDLNATTLVHGLCPKLSGTSTEYLDGSGAWSTPAGGSGTSITLPGSSSVYYNGNGGWTVPSASGSVFKPWVTVGPTGSGADYECDGVADNVQIQAAIDAVPEGGTVLILDGNYSCSSKIYKYGKSFSIEGVGEVNVTFSTAAAAANGFDFRGTTISYGSITMTTASKGAVDITVSSAASVQVGDIIHIMKDTLFSPIDSSSLQQAEIYIARSVSGSVITLNEPLIRDYASGDNSIVSIHRPVEIHFKNINITMASSTLNHTAFVGKVLKNSTIEGCTIRNAGMMGIATYISHNVRIFNNNVYDCIMTGSGYGIASWSGDAYIDIHDNYVDNCRHCISVNSDSTDVLSRKIFIHDNFVIGGYANGSHAIDAHQQMIDIYVINNIVINREYFYAMINGAQYSVIQGNTFYGGEGGVCTRGNIPDKVQIIKGNYVTPLSGHGYIYRGYGEGVGELFECTGNYLNGGQYGIMFNDDADEGESYANMVIKGNTIQNINYDGIVIKANTTGVKVDISGNYFEGIGGDGIYLDSNSNSFAFVSISDNKIVDPNENSTGGSGVCLVNISYSLIDGNHIYDSNTHAGYGVRTTGTSDYNVVINNVARGMTGTKFTLTGSNNQESNYSL